MYTLRFLVKKLPLDLGQKEYRLKTMGSQIAIQLAGLGYNRRALDLGCGEGFWTERLKEQGWNVTGIDISNEYPNVLYHDLNIGIPFPDSSVDLIFSLVTIGYITDTYAFIKEIRRVLKPQGRFIITTPNADLLKLKRLFQRIQDPKHKHFFTLPQVEHLFPDAQIHGYFPYALIKYRIQHLVGILSPTLIATGNRDNLKKLILEHKQVHRRKTKHPKNK